MAAVTTTVTAATTMTEPAAMTKAAAASITTAVESEANSKRTVEGRPIARIAIVRIVITPAAPIARVIGQISGRHRDQASLCIARLGRWDRRSWRRVRR